MIPLMHRVYTANMHKNNSGFSVLHALLLLLLIAIIGFTGWYVWQANDNIDSTLEVSSSEPVTELPAKKSAEQKDVTSIWLKYTAPNDVYSMKLADGLTFVKSEVDGPYYGISSDDVSAAQPGTRAKVIPAEPFNGKDGVLGMYVNYYQNAQAAETGNHKLQSTLKTSSGLKVDKYYYEQSTEPDGIGLRKGDKSYLYHVQNGSSLLQIDYSIPAGQSGNIDVVEQMVRTVNL